MREFHREATFENFRVGCEVFFDCFGNVTHGHVVLYVKDPTNECVWNIAKSCDIARKTSGLPFTGANLTDAQLEGRCRGAIMLMFTEAMSGLVSKL